MPKSWLTFAPIRLHPPLGSVAGKPGTAHVEDPMWDGWGLCRSCECRGYHQKGPRICSCGHSFSQHGSMRLWNFPAGLPMPYHFTERVSCRPIPNWVLLQDDKVDSLRQILLQKIPDGSQYCIAVE